MSVRLTQPFRKFMRALAYAAGSTYTSFDDTGLSLVIPDTKLLTVTVFRITASDPIRYIINGVNPRIECTNESDLKDQLKIIITNTKLPQPINTDQVLACYANPAPFIALTQPRFTLEFRRRLRMERGTYLMSSGNERMRFTFNGKQYIAIVEGYPLRYRLEQRDENVDDSGRTNAEVDMTTHIETEDDLMQKVLSVLPEGTIEKEQANGFSYTFRHFLQGVCSCTNGEKVKDSVGFFKFSFGSGREHSIDVLLSSLARDLPYYLTIGEARATTYASEEEVVQAIEKYLLTHSTSLGEMTAVADFCNDPQSVASAFEDNVGRASPPLDETHGLDIPRGSDRDSAPSIQRTLARIEELLISIPQEVAELKTLYNEIVKLIPIN